ncbi:DUF2339 domain-containing protein [Paraglaciecola sp.]|uniref:DUF2339 domain-containing protein n=1 Tax=Paraglaciecola sp. TaxID=1920173 RepID=UPI003EF86044
MASKDSKIDELQRELALTRVEFSSRLHKLEQKIVSLKNDADSTHHEHVELSEESQTTQPSANYSQQELKPEVQLATFIQTDKQEKAKPESKPSFARTLLKEFSQHLINLSSPLTKFISPAVSLYQHYQAKGQGPIFVFMLIGITLLVAGFGYLAQLLVGELGAGSKSLLLFIIAIGVTYGGVLLANRVKYAEISSAIISLGLLLNFVTVYMAGSYYQLLPDWAVLSGYLIIAAACFWLSNKFNAKVLSVIAVIGGAAVPLISQLDPSGTSLYLLGLGFIIMASLYQANDKNWPWLGIISVFVTYSCLEFLLLSMSVNQLIAYFSQGYYCLFLFYLCRFLNSTHQISKSIITLSVMILFASIGVFYQSEVTITWLVPLFAFVNGALSSYLVFKTKKQDGLSLSSHACSLHSLFASTWLLVAIVSSLAPDYWGFAIGVEGLFILYFALKQNYLSVRIEAYALLAFAILHAVFAVFPYFPDPALSSLKGNLVVASIGAIIFAARKLFSHYADVINWQWKWEQQLHRALRPVESVWLGLFILTLLWVQLGVWMAIAVLPLQIWLLTKTYRAQCKTSEIVTYLASAVAVGICILGINEVQSLSFRDLPNYAKAALIFVFAESWLFAEYYRRTNQTGHLAKLAEALRLTFYLVLPLTFLPSAIKHYNEFSAIAFWASASIAYLLGRAIKHAFIRTESLIIFAIAAVYNLAFTIDNYHHQALICSIANLIGLGIFSYFLINTHKQHAPLLNKKIASIGLYYLAGCIAIYMQEWTSFVWAGILTSVYIFAMVLSAQHNKILFRNRRILGYLSICSILLSWLLMAITGSAHIISSSIWLSLSMVIPLTFLLKTHSLNLLDLWLINHNKTGYTLLHVLLSASGMLLLNEWKLTLLITPWLILHGSYLFFTHKNSKFIAKLALTFMALGLAKLGLIDAANAILWQKVALMIGIGLFMLAAAFMYQKRINQTDKSVKI